MLASTSAISPRPRISSLSLADDACASTRQYVAGFLEDNPDQILTYGDDSATTYGCVGLVLLAAAHANTSDPTKLSTITGFLEEFAEAVINLMDRMQLWASDWFLGLLQDAATVDIAKVELAGAVAYAVERLWMAGWPCDYMVWLEITRARLLFGGGVQPYVDTTFLSEFVPTAVPALL